MLPKINPTTTKAWASLKEHSIEMKTVKVKDMFAGDSERFAKLHRRLDDTIFDYSKNTSFYRKTLS
jgi:glucose-6-phosphate isomerase